MRSNSTKKETMFAIVGVVNYLVVAFLNAFTDLGHKIIIQNTVFKIYDGELQIILTAVVNALVILPFILMFSPSGFLADKFAKNKIMEYSALFAVVITLGITYAYYHGYFLMAFAMTFLLAFQSALYGPAKYGYIKELVGVKYLSAGNGAVQAVTTVAILSGILFYTILFENMLDGSYKTKEDVLQLIAPLGWLLVFGSVIEWLLAARLPNKMEEKSNKRFKFSRYIKGYYLRKNMKVLSRNKEILESVFALSIFWSISQVILAVFGEYAKSELHITNTIFVQGVMALAGIGIVVGSVVAAKLSKYFINSGVAALGAVGITLIIFVIPTTESMSTMALLFSLFGIFSGFIIVPLPAKIQFLAPRVHLGTVLAGNNFIQNIFMFSSLMLTTLFAYYGMNAQVLIYMMGIIGILLSYIVLRRYLLIAIWAFIEILLGVMYKINYRGLENIPKDKAVLLLANHISWLDWGVLQIPLERRIHYMIDRDIYHWKFFHTLFKFGEAIPVSSKGAKDAFIQAHRHLLEGSIVGIFPEGEISSNERLGTFHRGYEMIPNDYNGVIIPCYIDGFFGTLFARYKGTQKKSFFKRREINIYFAPAMSSDTKSEDVQKVIQKLKDKYETK